MISEVVNKLKEKYLELKQSGLDENSIFKLVTDQLSEELRKMTVDERARFFLAFDRDNKLKEILDEE